MPSATSGWWITVFPSAPKRMSQDATSSLPPPPTRPPISARVALGMLRKLSHMA
jgi:hypothetical protein